MKLLGLFLGIILGAVGVFFWILDYGIIITRGTDENIATLERRLELHSQRDKIKYPGDKITNFNAPSNFVVLVCRDRHRNLREFFTTRGRHGSFPFQLAPIFEEGQYWFIDSLGIDVGFVNFIVTQE
ncbi:MAG: hypothetical protein DDT32_00060 [Syntrophomonadaceae bacterium]|nr:hypothetical protein [Bacillota bacterium]